MRSSYRAIKNPLREDIEAATVAVLYKDGMSIERIAEKFETSSSTIVRRLASLGLERRDPRAQPSADFDNNTISNMYRSGVSIEDIARRLEASPSTILKRLRAMKISRRGPGRTKEGIDNNLVISLYESGMTLEQVGDVVGLSEAGVRSRLKRAGIERRTTAGKTEKQGIRFNPVYSSLAIVEEPTRLEKDDFLTYVPSPVWAMALGGHPFFTPLSLHRHRNQGIDIADQYFSFRLGVRVKDISLTETLRKLYLLYEPEWLRMDGNGNMLVIADSTVILPQENNANYEVVVASEETIRNIDRFLASVGEMVASYLR